MANYISLQERTKFLYEVFEFTFSYDAFCLLEDYFRNTFNKKPSCVGWYVDFANLTNTQLKDMMDYFAYGWQKERKNWQKEIVDVVSDYYDVRRIHKDIIPQYCNH